MSAQDKKIYKAVAYSAGGALLAHLVVFLFFAGLLQAGYFSPKPPDEKAEQFEITFMEDEPEPAPVPEPEPVAEPLLVSREEGKQKSSAFFNTDGLVDTKTANPNAPFISDKDTVAASETPAEKGSTSPMPTITEGVERDLPSKDIFQQTYSEGPGELPQPNTPLSPPNPGTTAPAEPEVAALPSQPIEPELPMVEPLPEPVALPEPKPEVAKVEPPPEPVALPEPKPEVAKVEPTPEPVALPEPKPEVAKVEPPPEPVALPEPKPEVAKVEPPPEPVAPPEPIVEQPRLEDLAKVTPPAAPTLPVMPEASLPPVPEVINVAEPEETSVDPDALAAAEKPKPPEPIKKREREAAADPTAPPPSLDPTLSPGGYKPDPSVLALLDMTKDQPEPLPKPQDLDDTPDPLPAPKPDVESLLERQRRNASKPNASGYQAERTPTRLKGGVSNKGPNSVDSQATPQGRYQAVVASAVERNWYSYTKRRAQDFTIGTAKVRFGISKEGKVELKNIRLIENTSNESFGTNCILAVKNAVYPPIPDELDHLLFDGMMEVEYTFSIY